MRAGIRIRLHPKISPIMEDLVASLVVTHIYRLTTVISSRARPSVSSSYNVKPIKNHREVSLIVEDIL
jgi:hypothetical protein